MKYLFSRQQKRRTMKGFTLIETLVSSMIITLTVLGPLTVASRASSYARATKDTLIANYLAQEAIELLRYQQDSIYIRCVQAESSACAMVGSELPNEAAWRIFKEGVGANVQGVSCFKVDNASGCSYDFINMIFAGTPVKYDSSQASCNTLSVQNATSLYVCSGVHGAGAGYTKSTFSRSVSVESLPTITGADQAYHDDLRVTVTITVRQANGYTKQIKVIDFLHPRA
jgi:type II secretory pathway pseudopilin PulG